jgi:hypothetical protein
MLGPCIEGILFRTHVPLVSRIRVLDVRYILQLAFIAALNCGMQKFRVTV